MYITSTFRALEFEYGLTFNFLLLTHIMIEPPLPTTKNVISSISSLCKTLVIEEDQLNEALALTDDNKYRSKKVPKSDGTNRTVHIPHRIIRLIQAKINKNIFIPLVQWPSYIYGSIPNSIDSNGEQIRRDYVTCAGNHCSAKSLLKMDIKEFFDNIHQDHVEAMFANFFHFKSDVPQVLAQLCCKNGTLIQGALTSSYIASLILHDVEAAVVQRLRRKNLVYTRLVDDISISSKISNYDFSFAESIVTEMLHKKDLPLNPHKTEVCYVSSKPLTVHGIRVNFSQPRFPANEIRKLRASVHNLTLLASQPGYRTTRSYRSDYAKCMGRVNKLKRVNHNKHSDFVNTLNKYQPLPSDKDLERCKSSLKRLIIDYPQKKGLPTYRVRFYRLHDRLNVLQRLSKYKKIARAIRKRMKTLIPPKDKNASSQRSR